MGYYVSSMGYSHGDVRFSPVVLGLGHRAKPMQGDLFDRLRAGSVLHHGRLRSPQRFSRLIQDIDLRSRILFRIADYRTCQRAVRAYRCPVSELHRLPRDAGYMR